MKPDPEGSKEVRTMLPLPLPLPPLPAQVLLQELVVCGGAHVWGWPLSVCLRGQAWRLNARRAAVAHLNELQVTSLPSAFGRPLFYVLQYFSAI